MTPWITNKKSQVIFLFTDHESFFNRLTFCCFVCFRRWPKSTVSSVLKGYFPIFQDKRFSDKSRPSVGFTPLQPSLWRITGFISYLTPYVIRCCANDATVLFGFETFTGNIPTYPVFLVFLQILVRWLQCPIRWVKVAT